jgi:hypothetical protein
LKIHILLRFYSNEMIRIYFLKKFNNVHSYIYFLLKIKLLLAILTYFTLGYFQLLQFFLAILCYFLAIINYFSLDYLQLL